MKSYKWINDNKDTDIRMSHDLNGKLDREAIRQAHTSLRMGTCITWFQTKRKFMQFAGHVG